MTIKQWHRHQFLGLCEAVRTQPITTREFIQASVALHVLSGQVPRSWRATGNRALKAAHITDAVRANTPTPGRLNLLDAESV